MKWDRLTQCGQHKSPPDTLGETETSDLSTEQKRISSLSEMSRGENVATGKSFCCKYASEVLATCPDDVKWLKEETQAQDENKL